MLSGYIALVALNGGLGNLLEVGIVAPQLLMLVLFGGGLLWVTWASRSELYASRRFVERSNECVQIFAGAICAAGGLSILGAYLGMPLNDSTFMTAFIVTLFALTMGGRMLARTALKLLRARDRNLRHVAIVGGGAKMRDLVWRILENKDSGIVINGVFGKGEDLKGLPDGVPVGGCLQDLTERMMREPIDEVMVTYSFTQSYNEVVDLIDRCRRVGVKVRMVDESLTPFGMRPRIEYMGDSLSLVYADAPNWGWRGQVKDTIDTVVAALAILTLLPVLALVALAIKLDSPGPVFFIQPRVGKNRQTFPFYKFRTMRKDAAAIQASLEKQNESAGPTFKMANDPRITRVGRFLRKYSIDELPQFLNVLKGEMSLVGPRPLPLRDVERFDTDWHSRRFSVKPGLTCSWVIAGRSELEFERWVEMDLAYIDNWSLRKDASIILNTIPAVLRGSGAY